jgi:hypothetical protein
VAGFVNTIIHIGQGKPLLRQVRKYLKEKAESQ